MRRTTLAFAIAASLILPATASAQEGIVVKRVAGLDRAERLAVRADADVKLVDALSLANTEVVKPEGDLDDALAALNANPDVVYAEPDSTVMPQSADSYFSWEYALENTGQTVNGYPGIADADIDAVEAWTRSTGAGATVAVVDTGIQLDHPDLAGQFTGNAGERGGGREGNGVDDDGNGYIDDWQGWDFANHDNTIETENASHGTHVAGTIAALADNGQGVAGVAPDAKLLPVKVFGTGGASASTVADAFEYAGRLGAAVVNASLGGYGVARVVEDAIKAHPQTLYVIAAGNDDGANAANYYPCNADAANVICVGASDNRDDRASFSNLSATAVDLFAPGEDVYSTFPTSGYHFMRGTSMATPQVAGAAALLAAARPGSTSAELKSALMASVDVPGTLTGLAVTNGRLNANHAIDALLNTVPAPDPTPTPTPSAPAPTPTPPPVVTPTPTPAPVKAVVKSLAVKVAGHTSARATYTLSANAKVTITVARTGCKSKKVCSSASSRWSESAQTGMRTFTVRTTGGRKLTVGRYTLKVATATSARSVTFSVR